MKRRLITMLLMGMLIVAIQGVCYGQNLLENGDFEEVGLDLAPAGWSLTPSRDTEVEFSYDENDKVSGSHAFKINIQNPAGRVTLMPEYASIASPEPGQTYELSFWIKAENLDVNSMMVTPVVRLNFKPTRTRPTPMLDLVADIDKDGQWQELSLQATAPDDAEHLILHIQLTQGTVWLDDITIEPVE